VADALCSTELSERSDGLFFAMVAASGGGLATSSSD